MLFFFTLHHLSKHSYFLSLSLSLSKFCTLKPFSQLPSHTPNSQISGMLHVILWVTLLFNSNALVGSLNEEGVALFTFKQSITQDPDGSLSNWNYSNESPCYWNGVTCKQQKVVSLSIPNKKLSGFLPSSLGSISGLRHVNLRDNRLYGSLPVELFKAQGLQGLVLYGNSFSGSLPFEIGDLRFLQYLDLSQNFFNGSFPRSILQCKRLRTLDLSQNNFSGSLPNGFGTVLVSLEKLDLSYNKFGGSVPNDLGKLSNLQGTVDLSHNLFSGSIPASLGDLPEKVYIDLTYNNLSGSIPQNGALMNRGPTAFIGNPGLCGPPLKNPCSSDTLGAVPPSLYPFLPSDYPPHGNGKNGQKHNGRGLSKSAVIAIVVCDVVGICLIGCLFSYCYARARPCSKSKEDEKGNRGECLCFRKDESDTFSQNIEQNELMPLDAQVTFDLDELLKASAFVLEKSGIGIVYKVVIDDGQTVTVRRLGEGGSQRFKEFQAEVEAIGKVKHPNIVTLRAYYWSVDEKLLIYEYVPNGNLAAALHAGKTETASFTPLSWSVRFKIIKGIARGLAYLHEFSPKKYIHGDLNPNNILLGHNMDPKIADFGLTRLASIAGGSPILQSNRITSENPQQRPETNATTEVSSISGSYSLSYYQAPESLKAMKPSQKWDVYSYGVILLEITTGRSPLIQMGNSEMEISQWIQHCIEEKKPVVDVLDPYLAEEPGKEHEIMAVINIAMACTNSSAEKRPAMRHVCDALDRLSESNE